MWCAGDGAPRPLQLERIPNMTIHPEAKNAVRNNLQQPFVFPPHTPAIMLSDDYNPVDFYDLRFKGMLRKILSTPTVSIFC